MKTNNKAISAFLEGIRNDAEKAGSEAELLAICGKVREFLSNGGTLAYDLSAYYWTAGVSALVGAIFAYCYLTIPEFENTLDLWGVGILVVLAIITLVALVSAGSLGETVDEICKDMFYKDLHYDNQFTDLPAAQCLSFSELEGKFGDFSRGDKKRAIDSMIGIVCKNKDGSSSLYRYYTFSYVEVTNTEVYVPNGKGGGTWVKTRVETTYHRYGILFDFPWVKNLAVTKGDGQSFDYQVSFETGSTDFNSTYSIGAETEHAAAKFLKPAVILAFENIAGYLSNLAVEFNKYGEMCVSFSDSDLIEMGCKYSFHQLDEFEKQIAAKNHPVKLTQLHEFISVLKRHNDDNFLV